MTHLQQAEKDLLLRRGEESLDARIVEAHRAYRYLVQAVAEDEDNPRSEEARRLLDLQENR